MTDSEAQLLTKKDYESDQAVRWCPGCGDYAVLAQTQKTMPTFGRKKEEFVFISGIGCSSRFPYYMNAYGFHTIHGRAPAVATGVKIANPELSVWVVTGDGDGLSIGGNHFMHALRRNMDINLLLFNNRIYGLTKGQYSPTSEVGKITKATPFGSIDYPLNPPSLALGAQATFVARTIDRWQAHMSDMIKRSYHHDGGSFIEIYQNCNIFNDGAFTAVSDRSAREDRILRLKHGKTFIFGREQNKGIRLNGLKPEVVDLGDGVNENQLLTHDQFSRDSTLANLLSGFDYPEFPVPMGILRQVENSTYEETIEQQIKTQIDEKGTGDMAALLRGSHAWTN